MSEQFRAPNGPRAARQRTERSLATLLATALGATALGATALGAAVAVVPVPVVPEPEPDRHSVGPATASSPTPVRTAVLAAPVRVLAAAPTYTVRPGDTVGHIAASLGTTVAAIVERNGLDQRAFIVAGQVLSIPGAEKAGGPKAGAEKAAPAAPAGKPAPPGAEHRVTSGDTVGAIAARYGTTTAAVVAANGLDARASIRAGQVLTIPGGGSAAPAAPAAAPALAPAAAPAPAEASGTAGAYTVVAGDTLSGIAARRGTSVEALRAANPELNGAATILIGQVIQVPGAQGASPAAASRSLPNTFLGRTYPEATVQAATANRDVLASRPAPSREEMQQLVAETARAHGVDPALAQAISFQESGFNMRAVSPANAVGAMQVIPSSGEWASTLAGRPIDLLDPRDNALAGVLILKAHAATGVDQPTVIAAYYQGMAGVTRNGMYPDTRRYVASVQTLMAQYR